MGLLRDFTRSLWSDFKGWIFAVGLGVLAGAVAGAVAAAKADVPYGLWIGAAVGGVLGLGAILVQTFFE